MLRKSVWKPSSIRPTPSLEACGRSDNLDQSCCVLTGRKLRCLAQPQPASADDLRSPPAAWALDYFRMWAPNTVFPNLILRHKDYLVARAQKNEDTPLTGGTFQNPSSNPGQSRTSLWVKFILLSEVFCCFVSKVRLGAQNNGERHRRKCSAHIRCPRFPLSRLQLAPAILLRSRAFLSPSLIYLFKFNCPLNDLFIIITITIVCVCIHLHVRVHLLLCIWVPEDVWSPEAGVTGSGEPFDISSGNSTGLLCKSSKCSELLSISPASNLVIL